MSKLEAAFCTIDTINKCIKLSNGIRCIRDTVPFRGAFEHSAYYTFGIVLLNTEDFDKLIKVINGKI